MDSVIDGGEVLKDIQVNTDTYRYQIRRLNTQASQKPTFNRSVRERGKQGVQLYHLPWPCDSAGFSMVFQFRNRRKVSSKGFSTTETSAHTAKRQVPFHKGVGLLCSRRQPTPLLHCHVPVEASVASVAFRFRATGFDFRYAPSHAVRTRYTPHATLRATSTCFRAEIPTTNNPHPRRKILPSTDLVKFRGGACFLGLLRTARRFATFCTCLFRSLRSSDFAPGLRLHWHLALAFRLATLAFRVPAEITVDGMPLAPSACTLRARCLKEITKCCGSR